MGNKKKRYTTPLPSDPVPQLNPDDDPYWKISSLQGVNSRNNRYIERFQKFIDRHYQWVDDIMTGVPTYYGVLGVLRGVSAEELLRHYEREKKFSVFSGETIQEAYNVLSNVLLRVKYDEFIPLFEHISQFLPPDTKEEITEAHETFVKNAKLFRRLGEVQKTHADYSLLVAKGMPDIFEFSGLSPGCTDEEIEKYSADGDEVSVAISSLLRDPVICDQFVFVTDFFLRTPNQKGKERRERMTKVWKTLDPSLVRRVMLMSLTTCEGFGEIIDRIEDIASENHDWIPYLPPSKETFFSVLGVDEAVVSLPKGELESVLRSRYRMLERTPRVNLAYTVLKGTTLREDYLWMREHYELHVLDEALEAEEEKPSPEEIMQQLMEKTFRTIGGGGWR